VSCRNHRNTFGACVRRGCRHLRSASWRSQTGICPIRRPNQDDSHQPTMNAILRRAKRRNNRRITVVRASRKAKGQKSKDE
jgi:hypothetical protein